MSFQEIVKRSRGWSNPEAQADDAAWASKERCPRGESRAGIGVARLGLFGIRAFGFFVVALMATAWFSADEPHQPRLHRHVLPGRKGISNLALALSVDGAHIATADTGGHVTLWRADDGWWSENRLEIGDLANTIAFSPDSRFLAIGGSGLAVWGLAAGETKLVRRIPAEQIRALAFSPDGKTLAIARARSRNLILWDVEKERQRACVPSQAAPASHLVFSADGRYLAVGGNAECGPVDILDVTTGESTLTTNKGTGPIKSLAVAPDGASIAIVGGYAVPVRLLDLKPGRLLRSFAGHKMGTNSVAFSPDGAVLATVGNDGMARLWSVATGEPLTTLDGRAMALNRVAFSADGRTLAATAIGDGGVRLWDVSAMPAVAGGKG